MTKPEEGSRFTSPILVEESALGDQKETMYRLLQCIMECCIVCQSLATCLSKCAQRVHAGDTVYSKSLTLGLTQCNTQRGSLCREMRASSFH